MRRYKTEAQAYDWLQVEGVDVPYPPAVREALDLVERETNRLKSEDVIVIDWGYGDQQEVIPTRKGRTDR